MWYRNGYLFEFLVYVLEMEKLWDCLLYFFLNFLIFCVNVDGVFFMDIKLWWYFCNCGEVILDSCV